MSLDNLDFPLENTTFRDVFVDPKVADSMLVEPGPNGWPQLKMEDLVPGTNAAKHYDLHFSDHPFLRGIKRTFCPSELREKRYEKKGNLLVSAYGKNIALLFCRQDDGQVSVTTLVTDSSYYIVAATHSVMNGYAEIDAASKRAAAQS
jgi:hypothetical protein